MSRRWSQLPCYGVHWSRLDRGLEFFSSLTFFDEEKIETSDKTGPINFIREKHVQSGMTREQVTLEILREIANSIHKFLEFTGECSQGGNPMPCLDTQIWIGSHSRNLMQLNQVDYEKVTLSFEHDGLSYQEVNRQRMMKSRAFDLDH